MGVLPLPVLLPPRARSRAVHVLDSGTFPEVFYALRTSAHTLFPPPSVLHTKLCVRSLFCSEPCILETKPHQAAEHLTVFQGCTVEEVTFSRCRLKGSLCRSLRSSHDGSG